jgi:lipopolysaccharide biosynthesis glycosyltransferase
MIHIAASCDKNYFTPFCVLLTSIFYNNKGTKLILHIILTGIDEKDKKIILDLAKINNVEIIFYTIDEKYIHNFNLPDHSWFTPAIYYRLFFPLLISNEINRLLYLDTDTIVIRSLKDLYNTNMMGMPVAAVVDRAASNTGCHFNSGVLLIDVREWIKQKVTERSIQFIKENPYNIPLGDQSALNAVLKNNWHKLSFRYNLMYRESPKFVTLKQLQSFVEDKVIIHYTTHQKPWKYDCVNRYRYVYHAYLRLSPMADKVSKYSNFVYSWECIKKLLNIRINEFYYNHPFFIMFWRKMKQIYFIYK